MTFHDALSPLTPLTPFTPLVIVSSSFELQTDDNDLPTELWRQQLATPKFNTVHGLLAPPSQLSRSKTPRRRSSPLSSYRRQRSPRTPTKGLNDLKFELPRGGNNLAARRQRRQQRKLQLQRSYAQPREVHPLPKPLCPRVAELLRRVGMIDYGSLFQVEEIDYEVFCTLSERDLVQLGIKDAGDRRDIYKAVVLAPDFAVERRF